MMNEVGRRELLEFLAHHDTLALSTKGTGEFPEVAPVFFAAGEDLLLYFVSSRESSHSRNAARDERVAGAVYRDGQERAILQGLQLWGCCTAVPDQELEAARKIYLKKFPFIQQKPFLLKLFHDQQLYQLRPCKVRLIDNARGFGHKKEWVLD